MGWGWEENTIILGGGRIITKCSVQKSFVIKIVYTVKSECLFFIFLLFLGNRSILTCET